MKNIFILLFAISFALSLNAQNKVIEAFSNSYTLEGNGDYSGAIKTLKTVFTEDSYEINLRLGWLNYMTGLFTESVAFYQKAIILMPYSIEAKLGLVYPLSALGSWDNILAQYTEILKIDPNNSLVNYRAGSIYYGREQYETAYKYFEKVVNLYPFDFDGVIMFAWTNYKLGKTREAKVLFTKALIINPGNSSALEGLNLAK